MFFYIEYTIKSLFNVQHICVHVFWHLLYWMCVILFQYLCTSAFLVSPVLAQMSICSLRGKYLWFLGQCLVIFYPGSSKSWPVSFRAVHSSLSNEVGLDNKCLDKTGCLLWQPRSGGDMLCSVQTLRLANLSNSFISL